jgi:hypothetical protein
MQTNTIEWRRIGIGVSIVWFIGFAWFLWPTKDEQDYDFLAICNSRLTSDNKKLPFFEKEERDKWQARNLAKYEECRSHAKVLFERQLAIDKKGVLWVCFVTVVFGWLFAWCMIGFVWWWTAVSKWIRRRIS